MAPRYFRRSRATVAVGTLAALALAACSGNGGDTAKPSNAEPTGSYTLKVAYSSDYVFDTADFAKKWWTQVGAQFKAAHPKATVQFIPIPGSYNDIVNKLSLLYRSPSTAPDVAEIPTAQIGLWGQSNYLLPLNDYLKTAPWWSSFPAVVQKEGTFSGKVYAVNHGENTSALYYNKDMFRKAGLPVPWTPKNWTDILAAAAKIKSKVPGVTPLWALAGTGSGANGLLQGINNLVVGTDTPTIYDEKNDKFVVDSPGLRQALDFYSKVYTQGLGANVSELFSPNAVTAPLKDFRDGKLAIAIGSNYYGGNWTKTISAPYWKEAPQVMGTAPIPRYAGGGQASTLGGWDLAIAAKSKVSKAAFEFIDTAQSSDNSIDASNWAGWVPPAVNDGGKDRYTEFAPPFNQFFATVLSSATLTPSNADYSVWAEGFGRATGAIAQHPTSTTVDQAINTLKSYVSNQLGPDRVESQP